MRKQDFMLILQAMAKDEFVAEVTSKNDLIYVRFSDGSKFCISVQEDK